MAKPVPFPVRTSSALLSDDFTAWASNGWVASGDDILIDAWGDTDQIMLFSQQLGTWGDDDIPFARSTKLTKTYSGLPSNTLLRLVCTVAWNYMDFGAAGKPIGMYVNDVLFAPSTTPSGTITPNTGQCVGYGRTNSAGEIEVAFGVENVTPSLDILIFFDSLEIATPSAELADIIIDSAVAWQMGNPTSITRGSLSFEANEEWENYPFPGKTMPVMGLDECVRSRPSVRGSMMLTGEDQFLMYRPGGAWSDGESAGGASVGATETIRTFTPGQFRSTLAAGAYLESFIVIWKRLRGDYVAVEFPFAVCTHFGIGSLDGDEGLIPVEIEARQANDGTPQTSVPYLVHILPATFEIGA